MILFLPMCASCLVSCSGPQSPATRPATLDQVPEYIYCPESEAEIVMTATLLVDGHQLDQRTYPLKPVPRDLLEKTATINPDGTFNLELSDYPAENFTRSGDGISSKTGHGIGFGSSIRIHNWMTPANPTTRPVNGRSPARLSVFAYWDFDDGRGRVKADLDVPIGQRTERRLSPHATLITEFRTPGR